MINWLIRRLVAQPEGESLDASVRTRAGLAASIICICCNVVLCVNKGVVGLLTGSVSLVADAVNNLSDASSNIVSLLGFRLAARPADVGHPYGHGRFEYLAGLSVAVIVCAVGLNLVTESVNKLLHPAFTEYSAASMAVLVLSMVVKTWMALFNKRLGHRIDSGTLLATAVDSRNDVITSGAVLAAVLISRATGIDLDGWAGLGVGLFVCAGGINLVRDTASPLLGQAPDEGLVERIHAKIMSYPGVLGTHDLMVHDYGPGRQFASAHVEMPGERDAFANHEVLDTIEHDIQRELGVEITLHCDPVVTDAPDGLDLRSWLNERVGDIDPRLSVHDVRQKRGFVAFDLVRPADFDMDDDDLLSRVSALVGEKCPGVPCVVTFDTGYVSPVSGGSVLADDAKD